MLRAACLALALILPALAAPAQEGPRAPEGILILDQERLYSESQYGLRVASELEAASQALAVENRTIEAALTEEELELTELRDTLSREEFAALAAEFDARVEGIRAEQEAKARALGTGADAARQRFFDLAVPVLLGIVRDRGAAVIIDRRSVLISADTVDITDAAIARIDADLGDGGDAPLVNLTPPPPQPEPRPDDAQVDP